MKRILFVFASVACVLAGCTLEPAERLLDSNAPVFTASFAESEATRTQLADNQTSVLWSEGDEISVFDGNKANQEYVAGGAGKTTDFTLKGSGTVTEAQTWYALYPYNAQASFDGTKIQTSLPAEFTLPGPGTFADGMNIAVASSSSLSLPFKNVLGWIPVAIKGATGVTKLVFKGNAEENVAGALLINGSDLSASLADPSLSKTLTLNLTRFEESASKEEAKYYYIPVVPQAFHSGFSIIITKADGDYTYTYDKDVSFARGEKRALFIEIPGGGEGGYIPLADLSDGNVLQFTVSPHQDINGEWTEKGKLYPDTHADIAWAQWTWDPNAYTYPESSETYGKKITPLFTNGTDKKDFNLVKLPFKGHSLVFNIPVASLPAGKSIVLNFKLQGGRYVPKGWTVEACIDGINWVAMNVTGDDPTKYINQTIKEKDSESGDSYDLIAPFIFTKGDATPVIEASYTATDNLVNTTVQLRIRALTYRIAGSSETAETYNFVPKWHNSYTNFYIYPVDKTSYPGPYISIR